MKKGFYRHYKHDPAGAVGNYCYEVVGVARDSEMGALSVAYRPLYETAWLAPADLVVRPFDMFIGTVEKEGKTMPRFAEISDPALVARLEEIRDEMYGGKNASISK